MAVGVPPAVPVCAEAVRIRARHGEVAAALPRGPSAVTRGEVERLRKMVRLLALPALSLREVEHPQARTVVYPELRQQHLDVSLRVPLKRQDGDRLGALAVNAVEEGLVALMPRCRVGQQREEARHCRRGRAPQEQASVVGVPPADVVVHHRGEHLR
eukprot:CAMPEP_0183376874 /NCGR_PEP_ID=MMETSP0164_2-20130417/121552_1 /TAXON_ID=221442 /ORGANISM="Coccolithus pelagicus ssp braarudi, Strain PLY182g" /LENGTH=156 /DNA_ID=CAMNT_0025554267 /DNA_START=67 /DNA_END=533 /DNA_ORIENTATION=-